VAHVQLVLLVQAAPLVLAQDRVVLLAQVAVLHVQVALHVQPVLVLEVLVQAALRDSVLQALALQAVVQDLQVVVVAVLAPLVHLERVALRTRAVSPSALREKNSSRDPHRASVVQWCHAATVTPLFAFAAEPQFRTLQTKLAQTLVS
jgi:hypothetical protein